MNFTKRTRWTLPMAGLMVVGAVTIGPPQTSAGARSADEPNLATQQIDEPTDVAGSPEIPRWALDDRAPTTHRLAVGEPFVVTLAPGADIVGFDGTLRYDDQSLEFGGAVSTQSSSTLFQNPDATGGVGLAVFPEPGTDTAQSAAASFEARFIAVEPGRLEVAFDVLTEIDRRGISIPSTVSSTVVVDVTDPASSAPLPDAPAPAAEPPPDVRTPADLPSDITDVDTTKDGEVTELDLTELKIGWDEQIASGESCDLDTSTMDDLDVDGDGCLGVADFAAVSDVAPAFTQRAALTQPGLTFVVTKPSDEPDSRESDDRCETLTGGCSLRAAIAQANATAGPNRIEFDIAGDGPHTITLGNKLPTINDTTGALVIDGYSQPGARPNTSQTVSNAVIKIGVKSADYVPQRTAFAVTSGGNTIRGLAVYNSYHSILVTGAAATGNIIAGNYIGTDPTATVVAGTVAGDDAGIELQNEATSNRIGTPALADRNVIAGNRSWGIRVEQVGTDSNLIQNNLFGIRPDGTGKLLSRGGIDVQFGPRQTLIGGRALHEHNVLSGHNYGAIDFSHNSIDNRLIGNYIGTDATGRAAFLWSANDTGVWIKDDSRGNRYEDNIIANSIKDGVHNKHNYTGGNTFINNRIGVGVTGAPMGNRDNGVLLRGQDDVFERNVIARNRYDGVRINSLNDFGENGDKVTQRNRISQNSFWGNGSLAIDIDPSGTNSNDPGDADTGTQQLLNHPEIPPAAATSGSVTGTACAGCEVEIYNADPTSTKDQGRQYLGTVVASDGTFRYNDRRIVSGRAITALAIDADGNTSEFTPLVVPSGSPGPAPAVPVLTSPGQQTFEPGSAAQLTLDATPAGVSYAALRLPDGLTIDQRTGTISGTPTLAGQFPVTLTAFNASGASHVDVLWTAGPKFPPTINNIANQSGQRGNSINIQIAASDANGDTLTYSTTGLPPGTQTNSTTGRITGTLNQVGTFQVTATVNDGTASASTTFTWTVAAAPTVPGKPTNVSVIAGSGSAVVSFSAPTSGGSVESYTVRAIDLTNAGRGGQTVTSSTSPVTITGLTNGDDYRFTVTANNAAGSGGSSAPSNTVTPTVDDAVAVNGPIPRSELEPAVRGKMTTLRSTSPAPLPVVSSVLYANCDAVRAAGADPIRRGEPGYSSSLDRDGDGVGCE